MNPPFDIENKPVEVKTDTRQENIYIFDNSDLILQIQKRAEEFVNKFYHPFKYFEALDLHNDYLDKD